MLVFLHSILFHRILLIILNNFSLFIVLAAIILSASCLIKLDIKVDCDTGYL